METRFIKKQMTAAYQYSYTRLALNYYTLYETITEEPELSGKEGAFLATLHELIGAFLEGGDVLSRLDQLREEVTREVEILTAYTDCFQIYEYVLNRMERSYRSLPKTGLDDESFLAMLMAFITNTRESAVMNGRIRQIIGQLPVRLTKQKFYGLVLEGLSVYIGSPVESLHDMMYTLRTESMASLPEGMAEGRRALYETLMQFGHMDYRSLSPEAFTEAQAKLMGVSAELNEEAECFVSLQEIINDLYVLSLAKSDAVIDINEENLYRSIIAGVQDNLMKKDGSEPADSFAALLTQMEGRQEAYYERYLRSEIPPETPELLADPDYVRARNIDLLLSGSSFMSLKKTAAENDPKESELKKLVDRAYLEKTAEAYFSELDTVFSDTSRPVMRAIMAKVLSDLPVYFHSIDEIKSYIRGSLESCGDEAEKETCKELLEELMDYEDKLV